MPVSGRALGSGERASIGGSCPLSSLPVFRLFDESQNHPPLPFYFLLVYHPVHTIPARIYYLPRPRFLSGPSVAATTTIVSRKTRDKGEEGRERRSRYR